MIAALIQFSCALFSDPDAQLLLLAPNQLLLHSPPHHLCYAPLHAPPISTYTTISFLPSLGHLILLSDQSSLHTVHKLHH